MKQKINIWLTKWIIPIVLLLLPIRHIAQGVDISDTGYNLACFVWFGKRDGMWVYVTYLANAVGHLFTLLPMGNTMLGMNLYCSLVVSLIALCCWYFLKEKISFWFVFAGEVLAIMLCWCPHVILYNYLTYLALTLGTILLYHGIMKKSPLYFVIAGFVLGMGVGARFSNLTHMALIVGLWYYAWRTKRRFIEIVISTAWCILGYAVGVGTYLLMIWAQYGLEGYFQMLFGLQTMSQGGASGYSAGEMLIGAFTDYFGSMKWGILFLAYIALGLLFFRLMKKIIQEQRWFEITAKILYAVGFCILLRLVYGRGMFGFDYQVYFSIFWWVSLFNTAALLCNLLVLFRKDVSEEEKLLALLVLISILILPLGSNNRSYPVINNLFLIAPVTLSFLWKLLPKNYPVMLVTAGCLLVLFIQSIGFGNDFVFRDGNFAEKRDTKVENNVILKGMYTTADNAEALTGLTDFWEREKLTGSEVILYGDIPGVSYILNAPSAITSTWSNLESYNMLFWNRDFEKVKATIDSKRPVVMIGKQYEPIDEKIDYLKEFLEAYQYTKVYENQKIEVYLSNCP